VAVPLSNGTKERERPRRICLDCRSDDYADERLLAELVTRLDKHPTVGIAYCQSWKVDENDNILSSMQERTADLDEQRWKKSF